MPLSPRTFDYPNRRRKILLSFKVKCLVVANAVSIGRGSLAVKFFIKSVLLVLPIVSDDIRYLVARYNLGAVHQKSKGYDNGYKR